MNVLLSGIVGSTAYGLAHAGSDIDRLGIFAVSTTELFRLGRPKETVTTTAPDSTLHEAGKALGLIVKGNPTASEILYLETYETRTDLGDELIGLRHRLVSERAVRAAYLGYAGDQFKRLLRRGDGTFSSDVRNRSLKHARHLCRLVLMGTELHQTGTLTIRLADPAGVRSTAERIVADPTVGERLIAVAEAAFDRPGVLPAEPDVAAAEAWLRRVRRAYWEAAA